MGLMYHFSGMCPPSLLLRLLLSLGLVLNGSGYAFASGHASMVAHAQAAAQPQVQSPCHEGGDAQGPAMPMHGSDAVDVASGGVLSPPGEAHPPGHADPDCCDMGTCRCACMHGAVAAVAMLARAPFAAINGTAVRPLVSAHPAPVLPHLIRPPIG
jgi:hypothetical protein